MTAGCQSKYEKVEVPGTEQKLWPRSEQMQQLRQGKM